MTSFSIRESSGVGLKRVGGFVALKNAFRTKKK
jgi:hypothetical protein